MKIIAAILILLSAASSAHAIECAHAPDRTPGPFWRYRVIDNAQCWYRSESVLPKTELAWGKPEEESPRPELAMTFNAPLKPVSVQTIAYRVEPPPEDRGGLSLIALAVIAVGFGAGMAGMLWPIRSRRGAA